MENIVQPTDYRQSKIILLFKNMKHVVIIRMHYPRGDERFKWRFKYFKRMVLPRLLAQTDQDFDIAIRCNPIHNKLFERLSQKIKTFRVLNESERYKIVKIKRYFLDFAPWSDVVGLEKYQIQSGLDSDDLIAENYIETIKKEVAKYDKNKTLHMSFQPGIFNADTEQKHRINIRYSEKKGSAFFSIYQPNNSREYYFAYEFSHLELGKHFDKSIILPAGFCWASVHGHNISTTLHYAKN
jgi:hypothetical protein